MALLRLTRRGGRPHDPEADLAAARADAAFQESLRQRVAWQATTASRLRQGLPPVEAEEPVATAAPEQPRPAAVTVPGLPELERLVRAYEAVDPLRVEEWRFYLLFLRVQANADGTLPECFHELVATTFAPLLERQLGGPDEEGGDPAGREEGDERHADAARATAVPDDDRDGHG